MIAVLNYFSSMRKSRGNGFFAVGIIFLLGFLIVSRMLLWWFFPSMESSNFGELYGPVFRTLLIVLVFLGAVRVFYTDPTWYEGWLIHTPWERGDKMPFESPLMYRGDVPRLAIVFVTGAVSGGQGVEALVAYLVGYVLAALVKTPEGRLWLLSAGIVSTLAMPFLIVPNLNDASAWFVFGPFLILAIVLSNIGLKRSFDELCGEKIAEDFVMGSVGNLFSPRKAVASRGLRTPMAVAFALLFAAATRFMALTDDSQVSPVLTTILWVAVFAVCRAAGFVVRHRSPTGLLGRLASRRFIIPGYDRYLLPCLLSVLSVFPVIAAGKWLGFSPDYLAASVAFVGGLILLRVGPGFYEFHMTGEYRDRDWIGAGKKGEIERL